MKKPTGLPPRSVDGGLARNRLPPLARFFEGNFKTAHYRKLKAKFGRGGASAAKVSSCARQNRIQLMKEICEKTRHSYEIRQGTSLLTICTSAMLSATNTAFST